MPNNNQNKYYSLFNQIADPIFIFEKNECQILDCNKSVNRIYGYSNAELNQMTFLDLHPPEELERVKKAEKGRIEISTFSNNGDFCFKFKDDGQGINLKKLRKTTESTGKWDKNEIDNWDNNQIANLIFESGISTSETADLNAGRGVGMGAIKDSVENHQGKISMNFSEGKFLEFIVKLPMKN